MAILDAPLPICIQESWEAPVTWVVEVSMFPEPISAQAQWEYGSKPKRGTNSISAGN